MDKDTLIYIVVGIIIFLFNLKKKKKEGEVETLGEPMVEQPAAKPVQKPKSQPATMPMKQPVVVKKVTSTQVSKPMPVKDNVEEIFSVAQFSSEGAHIDNLPTIDDGGVREVTDVERINDYTANEVVENFDAKKAVIYQTIFAPKYF